MKRFLISFICVLIIISMSFCASAQVIGHIYKTDITAYENYLQIPSYNCGGTTVVFARDLENYGYDILWDGATSTVEIKKNHSKKASPILPYFEGYVPVGEILYDIYASSVKIYYRGKEIPGYNIGGKVAIRLRDLDYKGNMVFDGDEKTASFFTKEYSFSHEEMEHCHYYYKLIALMNQLDFDLSEAIYEMSSNKINSHNIEMINASYVKFSDAKEIFTDYVEPECFLKSTTELWWAMVNIDLATKLVKNNRSSFSGDNHALYQRYYYDSINQRQASLELFSDEIQLKEKN